MLARHVYPEASVVWSCQQVGLVGGCLFVNKVTSQMALEACFWGRKSLDGLSEPSRGGFVKEEALRPAELWLTWHAAEGRAGRGEGMLNPGSSTMCRRLFLECVSEHAALHMPVITIRCQETDMDIAYVVA